MKEYQKAKAKLVEGKTMNYWVVPVCPLCGEEHTHGAGDKGGDPLLLLGHRSAHCVPNKLNDGYILVQAKGDT